MRVTSLNSMSTRKRFLFVSSMISILALAVVACTAPTETNGVSIEVVHTSSLGEQIPQMEGYQLRGRKITFFPGGGIVEHSHAERPGMVYVISGEITEVRNGITRVYRAGDTWIETSDTVHWASNLSLRPAVIWMVDLPPVEEAAADFIRRL